MTKFGAPQMYHYITNQIYGIHGSTQNLTYLLKNFVKYCQRTR